MIKRDNDKTTNIAMELASLSLAGKKLEKIPYSDKDLEAVYEYVKISGISAITFMALENAVDAADESSFMFEWKKMRLNAMRRNLLFDQERSEITKFLEQNGIWYLPLKGSVIKEMYPNPEMREMNDNDILIDQNGRDQAKDFMLSRGYQVKPNDKGVIDDKGNSDEFIKDPFFYFELHKFLIEERYSPKQYDYFLSIKDRLIKDTDKEYGYHMSDEDFYLYMICHAHKHFSRNGMGIRFLVDEYVFLKEKGETLDNDYINEKIREFGLEQFDADLRKVSKMAFDEDVECLEESLSDSEKALYDSCLGAGIFGNIETRWKNEAYEMSANSTDTITKKEYIKNRLFPDEKWYRIYHPFVYKHKIVKPFFTIYRLTVLAFRGRKNVKKEMDQVGEKNA
ncbi:MAG TPA: hypothetical protein DCR28_00370 [Eubacterium sp.]|nr:hypothetical protein [Eubacterium sp.]